MASSIVAMFVTVLAFPPCVFADVEDLTVTTGCTDDPSYTGVLALKKGSYDVYARLAKCGQQAKVSSYMQKSESTYGDCSNVGSVSANGDSWTKVGSFAANRSSVMLLPQKNRCVCTKTRMYRDS